jgi:hypothetical protein
MMDGKRCAVLIALAAVITAESRVFCQNTIEDLDAKYPWRGGALRIQRELHLREKAAAEKAAAEKASIPETVDPEAARLARACLFSALGKVRYTREEIVFSKAGEKLDGSVGLEVAAGSAAAVNVIHQGGAAIDQVVHFVLGPHFDTVSNTGYAYLRRENVWGAVRTEQFFQWAIPPEYPQGINVLHACTYLRDGAALRSRLILRISQTGPPAAAAVP